MNAGVPATAHQPINCLLLAAACGQAALIEFAFALQSLTIIYYNSKLMTEIHEINPFYEWMEGINERNK